MNDLSVEAKADLYDEIVRLVAKRMLEAAGENRQAAKGGEAVESEAAVLAGAAKVGK